MDQAGTLQADMFASMEYMSLWELAHRWEDADPMTPPGTPVPLQVQPILRCLSHAVAKGKLYACRPIYWEPDDTHPDDPNPRVEAVFSSQHNELPTTADLDVLLSCAPDRKVLDGLFVALSDAFYWAVRQNPPLPIPDFIIPPSARSKERQEAKPQGPVATATPRRPMEELLDKAASQGAAKALWKIHPEMPITHVCEHPGFLEAGARNYSEVTRRNWAREVAPQSVKERVGRPKATS